MNLEWKTTEWKHSPISTTGTGSRAWLHQVAIFLYWIAEQIYIFCFYRLSVRVLSSERAGSGKSLVVRRLGENLLQLTNNDQVMRYLRDMDAEVPLCISVPIYGPAVDQCTVVEPLLPHTIVPDLPLSRIFHLDVHPSVRNSFSSGYFTFCLSIRWRCCALLK